MPHYEGDGSYQYKYNGKEYQDELGQNVYAFGWRDYDPAIGRFNKMDRFSEKYFNLTPYGYAGNNPVLFNDIQGDSIGVGKNLFESFRNEAQTRKSNILQNRKSQIDKAIAKGNTDKVKRLNERFANQDAKAGSEMSLLNNTLSELSALESSSQVYNLYENSSAVPSGADGVTTYDTSTGTVNISSRGKYSHGVFAHELKHAYQFQTGSLSFDSSGINGGSLYDLNDEYEAFDRGSYFGGLSLTRSQIDNIYIPRGVPSGIRNMSTPSANFSGAPTLGKQMILQTISNTIRGSAQSGMYIGSRDIQHVVSGLSSYRF
jgi:RHS repeat-associated protein